MGYNIEVSFNVLKNGSVSEQLEIIKKYAYNCDCENIYEQYEFENKVQFQRRHCIVSIFFTHSNINNMIEFLNSIKKENKLYIEMVYDDINNIMLYASQYYVTQKMDKNVAKNLKKRERIYSDDENMILKVVSKSNRSRAFSI
jgi:hypothetical protein